MADFTSHAPGTFSWPELSTSDRKAGNAFYSALFGCDASTAKAKELGGTVMVGPQDIPTTGRFAIMSDPQGAMCAVFEFTEKK